MNSQAGGGGGEGEKKQKKEKKTASAKENFDEYHVLGAEREGKGTKKRLSVERIYQKKSQLEHILLRPDTYVISVEAVTQVYTCSQKEGNGVILGEKNSFSLFTSSIRSHADYIMQE